MSKVILLCGKVCSGNSFYARSLKEKVNGVILSCDELVTSIMGYYLGDKHDEIVLRTKKYLYKKSCEIVSLGIDVILDLGFWSKKERVEVSNYYNELDIIYEWHYIDINDEQWIKNINERNILVKRGLSSDYYIDKEIINKVNLLFEKPSKSEVDIWINNNRK